MGWEPERVRGGRGVLGGGGGKWEFLKKREEEGADLSNVLQLRNVCLYVLSYLGFFRSEEVRNIRMSHIRFLRRVHDCQSRQKQD